MLARDVMTPNPITVTADARLLEALELMIAHRVSGLPVLDDAGALVGILTEGDLLRRAELGTERPRPAWLERLRGPEPRAADYVRIHTRAVRDVMTQDPRSVDESVDLAIVVDLMERHRFRRVPVLAAGALAGIVARADLVRALASALRENSGIDRPDDAVEADVRAALRRAEWWSNVRVDVRVVDGIVHLDGRVIGAHLRDLPRVLAENIPGVAGVDNRILVLDPNFPLIG